MSVIENFRKSMPTMLQHEGNWEGVYTHVNDRASIIDQHKVQIRCEFPVTGPYVYVQYNHFIWEDGREYKAQLPGVYKDGRLWWDLEAFHGSAWETKDNIILLNLTRKDDPGTHFFEMITIGDTGKHRSRTWQWFKNGRLFKRTLCDEWRVS